MTKKETVDKAISNWHQSVADEQAFINSGTGEDYRVQRAHRRIAELRIAIELLADFSWTEAV